MRVKTGQFRCQHNIAQEFYKQRFASGSIIPLTVFHRAGRRPAAVQLPVADILSSLPP